MTGSGGSEFNRASPDHNASPNRNLFERTHCKRGNMVHIYIQLHLYIYTGIYIYIYIYTISTMEIAM